MSLQYGRRVFWMSRTKRKRRGTYLFESAQDSSRCFVLSEHDNRVHNLDKSWIQPTKLDTEDTQEKPHV